LPCEKGGPEMEPSEVEVFLEALNRSEPDGAAMEQMSRVALLKRRLGAVRGEVLCLKLELETARGKIAWQEDWIARQEARIGVLDQLLKDVYASRSYRLANWCQGKLQALRGLFAGKRPGPPSESG
jgi:hypothetical protein